MGRQKVYLDKLARFFQVRNLLLRQALAECLGTLILVVSVPPCVYTFVDVWIKITEIGVKKNYTKKVAKLYENCICTLIL